MTVLCGGGTSSPQPGAPPLATIGSDVVQTILGSFFPELVIPLLIANVLPPFVASVICGTDPPAVQNMSPLETYLALQPFQFDTATIAARAKLIANITNAMWFALCRCDTTTTPAPTPPVVQLPNPQIPDLTGATSSCRTQTQTNSIGIPTTNFAIMNFVPDGLALVYGHYSLMAFTGGGGRSITTQLTHRGAGQVLVVDREIVQTFTSGVEQAATFNIPPGVDLITSFLTVSSGTGLLNYTFTMDIWCEGSRNPAIPAVNAGVGPGDAAVLQQILAGVTLIQRQAAAFAYVPGASHSVTGHGQIAVSSLIGAKVVITGSITGTIGVVSGNPDEEFGLGWITWGNADGWSGREFLGHGNNVSFPGQAGQYTLLGYSLAPGVSATITELVRES